MTNESYQYISSDISHKNIHAFLFTYFISNARLKFAKNQANAKQHPEAELLLLENHSHSSSMLSSKHKKKKISKRTSMSVFMRLYDLL